MSETLEWVKNIFVRFIGVAKEYSRQKSSLSKELEARKNQDFGRIVYKSIRLNARCIGNVITDEISKGEEQKSKEFFKSGLRF